MEPLLLAGTDDTPEVIFNKDEGIFLITGKSLPEDVIQFYAPVFIWLEQYVSDPNEETVIKVQVDYFNSASQRSLNEVFTILSRIKIKQKKLEVMWYYVEDDYEMKEAGEEYADITNIPFHLISYIPE